MELEKRMDMPSGLLLSDWDTEVSNNEELMDILLAGELCDVKETVMHLWVLGWSSRKEDFHSVEQHKILDKNDERMGKNLGHV